VNAPRAFRFEGENLVAEIEQAGLDDMLLSAKQSYSSRAIQLSLYNKVPALCNRVALHLRSLPACATANGLFVLPTY
jgi:hypothetical protein